MWVSRLEYCEYYWMAFMNREQIRPRSHYKLMSVPSVPAGHPSLAWSGRFVRFRQITEVLFHIKTIHNLEWPARK